MNRLFFLDALKMTMALAVVGLHAKFLLDINPTIGQLMVNGIFRTAVPIFFLINGYFFYTAIQKKTHKGWLKKVIFLYIFWSILYSETWIYIMVNAFENGIYTLPAIYTSIYVFFGFFHLWYFPAIIGAALITMACHKKVPEKRVIGPCIALYAIAVYTNYYLVSTNIMNAYLNISVIYKNFLFFAFPFFYIGFYINKSKLHEKITANRLYIIAIISTTTLLIEAYSFQSKMLKNEALDCLLSLLPLCVSIFLLALKTKKQSISRNITTYATGIYFFHVYILEKMQVAGITNSITLTLITIILSILSCYILMRITKNRPMII